MGEGLQLFAKEWGPESLVTFFVLTIALGFLIPRWSVNKTVGILEKRITESLERERYQRDANDKLQATIRLQAEQLEASMELSRTTLALVGSIEAAAAENRLGRHRGDDARRREA